MTANGGEFSQFDQQQQAWLKSVPRLHFMSSEHIMIPSSPPSLAASAKAQLEELKAM